LQVSIHIKVEITYKLHNTCCQLLKTVFYSNDKNVNEKTVLHTNDVQPFVYKCALHFEKTRLHKTLSLMCALWEHMKISPYLKILSTGQR